MWTGAQSAALPEAEGGNRLSEALQLDRCLLGGQIVRLQPFSGPPEGLLAQQDFPAPACACRRAARLVTSPTAVTFAPSVSRPTTAEPTAIPLPTGNPA